MRIFFSVGEPSGDIHGANLINDLKSIDPGIEFVGFGGPKMKQAGCHVIFDLTRFAVMFIITALFHLPKFFRAKSMAKKYLDQNKVDAVVLIDFPGFNWHIAKAAKQRGIPVFYYGVPQMWAWASWRIRKMRRNVDFALCKLPFEEKWYSDRGVNATYVGHPYFDELANRKLDRSMIDSLVSSNQQRLTLLPGSRKQEVIGNTDTMIRIAKETLMEHPQTHVVFACYKDSQLEYVKQRMQKHGVHFDAFAGKTAELIEAATVCVACSGSVSLELMYHHKPTIIIYRLGLIKYYLQSMLLKIKFITLVNLLATDSIEKQNWKTYAPDAADAEPIPMPEYLSVTDCTKPVVRRVTGWLENDESRNANIDELKQLSNRYAKTGASIKAAEFIMGQLLSGLAKPSSRAA